MKVGFALAAVAAGGPDMAGMAGAFILDFQQAGRESGAQFFTHRRSNAHGTKFSCRGRKSSNTFPCLLRFASHNLPMVQPRGSRFKSDIRIKPEKARKPEPESRM